MMKAEKGLQEEGNEKNGCRGSRAEFGFYQSLFDFCRPFSAVTFTVAKQSVEEDD